MKSCLIFLCFLAFIGCERSSNGQLRVQVFTGAYSSIPIHVADELGFFSRRGLSVQKVPANSSSAALAAMIGGSLDIVESGADLVMANIDKKSIAEEARVAALEVFEKDCLIRLGTCVAPVGSMSKSEVPLKINLEFKNGDKKSIDLQSGELIRIEVSYEEIKAELIPAKGINVGAGEGEKIDTIIYGGQVGLIFDGRGRPLDVDSDPNERISNLKKWAIALNEYPELKE